MQNNLLSVKRSELERNDITCDCLQSSGNCMVGSFGE